MKAILRFYDSTYSKRVKSERSHSFRVRRPLFSVRKFSPNNSRPHYYGCAVFDTWPANEKGHEASTLWGHNGNCAGTLCGTVRGRDTCACAGDECFWWIDFGGKAWKMSEGIMGWFCEWVSGQVRIGGCFFFWAFCFREFIFVFGFIDAPLCVGKSKLMHWNCWLESQTANDREFQKFRIRWIAIILKFERISQWLYYS